MPTFAKTLRSLSFLVCVLGLVVTAYSAENAEPPTKPKPQAADPKPDRDGERPSLFELKRTGYQRSRFRGVSASVAVAASHGQPPQANLREFEATIKPLLEQHCVDCHGPDGAEGNIRIDALDPDLLRGGDTDWWAEVFAVVTKGEMPPPDDAELNDADRRTIVEWLSHELQAVAVLRRKSGSRSAFRRLTRYEYNYALQDLLGLPWNFAKDLPPEPRSEEGFENSSELLHLSVSQFETYHRLAREALDRATVVGDRPQTLYWGVSMQAAADREWPKQAQRVEKTKKELADDPEKLQSELARLEEGFRRPHGVAYYKQLSTGRTAVAEWSYPGARYAFAPMETKPQFPSTCDCVAVLPVGRHQNLVVELGNQLPEEGTMGVTVRASKANTDGFGFPSLQLLFGWQASNEGRALLRVSKEDVPVTANPDESQTIQWDVPLGELYPRNSVRKTSPMGALPSPSEYIRIANSTASENDVQLDYVSVEAPVYDQWPPASHRSLFFESDHAEDELVYAREILQDFMARAWRRPTTTEEVERKLELFAAMRSESDSFEEAVCEVLATVLSSPQFLYVAHARPPGDGTERIESEANAEPTRIDAHQLATRLSLFLWSSIPDAELLALAESGELADADVLAAQVERMLTDPRGGRLSKHFVHQWLNLQLLEFVNLQGRLDPALKEAMQQLLNSILIQL